MLLTTIQKGFEGQLLAERYLEKAGFEILFRNLRIGRGELDLVAKERGVLVFVEIRSTTSIKRNAPLLPFSVLGKKTRILRRSIGLFFERYSRFKYQEYRLDFVWVYQDSLDHWKNVQL